MCCLLSKPKVSMTSLSLCSTAALDCHTGQSKGRYRERERSILLVLVALIHVTSCDTFSPVHTVLH